MIINPNTPGAGSGKYLPLTGGELSGPLKVLGNNGGKPDLVVGRDDMATGVGFKQSAVDSLMLARTDSAGRINGNARFGVADPVEDYDAATKGYVDKAVSAAIIDSWAGSY